MNTWVGIDVAKDTLAVFAQPQQHAWQFANSSAGHRALLQVLSEFSIERILLEATGGYEHTVLRALRGAGYTTIRINPQRVHAYAIAMNQLAKTDGLDAQLLANMAQAMKTPARFDPSPQEHALRALVQRREQLVQQRDDERRRQQQTQQPTIQASLQRCLRALQQEIARLNHTIAKAVSELNHQLAQRLRAVQGLGPVTIASLFAYAPELGQLNRRQIAALVGIAPYNHDSGRKTGKRHIYGGRARMRRVLYMAVLSVIRCQADFKLRYARLRQRGKCAKVALVACMRVLLIRLNAMVRDQTQWRSPAT